MSNRPMQVKEQRLQAYEAPMTQAKILGLHTGDALALHDEIEGGLPIKSFLLLQDTLDIDTKDLAGIVKIPLRTLARRKKLKDRLRPDESDRLLRVARVYKLALDLFESDRPAALAWLKRPNRALNGKTPLRLAATDVGAIEVERLVSRIEHGVTT
jgi:putative toxin-antitoxin system antitoxin component (TIGR02293 family)